MQSTGDYAGQYETGHATWSKLMKPEREALVRAELERRKRERIRQAGFGWHEITNRDEVAPVSERFFTTFFPTTGRSVPDPFITWDVSHATNGPANSPQQRAMINDLHRKCLPAMKRCEPNAVWFVLENINHPWYRVHFSETPDHIVDWPVELLPYADPCYIVTQDFSCGFIADLDRTISVFGRQLLNAIQENLPFVFTTVVESSLG